MAFLDTGSNCSDLLVATGTHLQVVICQTDLLVRSKFFCFVYCHAGTFNALGRELPDDAWMMSSKSQQNRCTG